MIYWWERKKFQRAANYYSWFYNPNYNGHYAFSVNVKCVFAWHATRPSHPDVDLHRLRSLDHCGWPRPALLLLLTLKNAERALKVPKVFSAHGSASEGRSDISVDQTAEVGFSCARIHLKSQKETWTSSLRCPKRRLFSPGGLSSVCYGTNSS